MKNIRLFTVVLLTILCAAVYAGDVCSVSYDKSGNMKLRAGLGIDSSVKVSSSASWFFLNPKNDTRSPYPGSYIDGESSKPTELNEVSAEWSSSGRWFVTLAHGKNTQKVHYTNGVGVAPELAKSVNNGIGMDLTPMITSTSWQVDKERGLEDFYCTQGDTQPAGKFCMFRVRVTDNGGANERYYWVGDSSTGSFTYYREWVSDNFKSNPGKGKYGEYGEATWTIAEENIDVYIKVNTMYDQARFEINLINNSDTSKYASVAMYGTPATSNDPCLQWGKKPYVGWRTMYDKETLLGWTVYQNEGDPYAYPELVSETNKSYFYLPGIGTIDEPTIISKNAIPNRLEMYNYRWTNANAESGLNAPSRIDDSSLEEENVDSTYTLPPKSSMLNYNFLNKSPKVGGNDAAFQSVAQATFENNGDATKPDYLIIDKSSNLLQFTNRTSQNKYPFGFWADEVYGDAIFPDDGNFPVETYWPGDEEGVKKTYESTIEASKAWPYADQYTDPLSYMTVWGSQLITSGSSRKIVTYYGLGGKSFTNGYNTNNTFTRQGHSVFVEAPAVLGYSLMNTGIGTDAIVPDTFTVSPVITNQGAEKSIYDFVITKVSITLSDGLELADDSDHDGGVFVQSEEDANTYEVDKNITVRNLGIYDAIKISVKANGLFSGDLKYTVKVYGHEKSGSDEWIQEVSRAILVPTTKTGYIYGGPGNLVATPFKDVTGSESDFNVYSVYGDDAAGFIWDSANQEYVPFADLGQFSYTGNGYWILKGYDEDSDNLYSYIFPESVKPKDVDYGDVDSIKYYMSEMTISLNKKWNIVSNPYIYPMQWTSVLVKDKMTGDVKSMQDAVKAGWVYKTMFSWEPEKGTSGSMDPTLSKYVGHSTSATQLIPNKGYWIYSAKELELYFKPAVYPESRIYDSKWFGTDDKYFKMGYSSDEDYK